MAPSTAASKRAWDLPVLKDVFELFEVRLPCRNYELVTTTGVARDFGFRSGVGDWTNEKASGRSGQSGQNGISNIFDAKFYPYTKPGVDPIFAVAANHETFVMRPTRLKDRKPEILCRIRDNNEDGSENSSVVWTKDIDTGTPLLCVAGGGAIIKIYNALTGELLRAFPGHGGDINDLAISPTNPEVLASCSADLTVRIWSLNPEDVENPLLAILAGDAHRDTILTIAFHANGKYILSGGQDQFVNLWTLPKLPIGVRSVETPLSVFYPHFSSSEIHYFYVDCITFHNDLILSKANDENCIVLWMIVGFDSSQPPPPPSSAPTDYSNGTRSAFVPSSPSRPKYMRLLQFDFPGGNEFYMRFSLSTNILGSGFDPTYDDTVTAHPILSICNSSSRVFFWDLSRLEAFAAYKKSLSVHRAALAARDSHLQGPTLSAPLLPRPELPERPHWLQPLRSRTAAPTQQHGLGRLVLLEDRDDASSATGSSHTDAPLEVGGPEMREIGRSMRLWERRYGTGDSLGGSTAHFDAARSDSEAESTQDEEEDEEEEVVGKGKARSKSKSKGKGKSKAVMNKKGKVMYGLEAHRVEMMPKYMVVGRQIAWSVGGEWCVVVGSPNIVGIFWRWEGKFLEGGGSTVDEIGARTLAEALGGGVEEEDVVMSGA